MMLNSLEGDNWLAMEDVSLDRFDTMKAFDEFYKVFDRDYQYDPEQELPARMEELVTGFYRQRAEPLRLYVRRLDALVVKLRELKIEWPSRSSDGFSCTVRPYPPGRFRMWGGVWARGSPTLLSEMRCITYLDQIPSPIPVMSYE